MILRQLLDQVKIENINGDQINPATTENIAQLETLLTQIYSAVDGLELSADNIDINTDELETKVQSVRDQLDVVLSSRVSEATGQSILNALGELSGTDLLTELQNLVAKDFATESTLIEVRDYLDTVETKLQTIIDKFDVNLSTRASESTVTEIRDTIGQESGKTLLGEIDDLTNKDFATEATSTAILNTIGEESGNTVLSKLQNIWDKLVSLFTNGTALVKLWDGTTVAKISETGRQLIDTSPPAPPPDTTAVVVTEYSDVSTDDDYDYVIPNGATLQLQRLSGGAEPGDGSVVELWYDPDGTKTSMEIIDVIFSDGHSDQHDLNDEFEGDGTAQIVMRRAGLGSSSARWIFGRWEGYY